MAKLSTASADAKKMKKPDMTATTSDNDFVVIRKRP
jgi:hypothetical protein